MQSGASGFHIPRGCTLVLGVYLACYLTRLWLMTRLAKLPDPAPVEVADGLQSFEPRLWLPLLQRWVMDLGRVKQGAAPRYFPQWSGRLQELAGRSDTDRLVKAGRVLAGQFRLVGHPLNPRLFCEESLGALASAFTPIASLERGR